jgi:SAM-dependent methyltransferase
MTETTTASVWDELAELWVEEWARLADPAREAVLHDAAIGVGTQVLDLGCGSGEFLDRAAAQGAEVTGIDAAQAMVVLARRRLPGADVRVGPIEQLPWPDGAFDVVTACNAVQYAADRGAALAEAARVARPGGLVAVTAWAADERCEVEAVSIALEELAAGGPVAREARLGGPVAREVRLGEPGVIDALAASVGLEVVSARDVDVPYEVPGEAALQRAFRLDAALAGALERAGEDAVRAAVARAAAPFRRPDGSYRFANVFRVVVARVPASS